MIDMVQNPTEVFDQLVETAAELARRSTEWRKLASSWMDDHPMKISEEEAAVIKECHKVSAGMDGQIYLYAPLQFAY